MEQTDLVRVFRVDSGDTLTPGLKVFVITTTLLARPTECLQLETVNSFAASICQRAKERNRTVAVTWEKTKYGSTLKSAYFLTSAQT